MSNTASPIANLRKSYELAELVEANASTDPFAQFEGWLNEAIAHKIP
jgi:pyridoxine/pyridoxamine 5'-phosphate oxidase